MSSSYFQDIPKQYKSLIDQIEDQFMLNIYNKVTFMYFNSKAIEDSGITTDFIEMYLTKYLKIYKFITYCLSDISDYIRFSPKNYYHTKNKNTNASINVIDWIICVEGQCIIIEKLHFSSILKIIENLQKEKVSMINVSDDDYIKYFKKNINELEAEEEVRNFCSKFGKLIKNNPFVKCTIPTIISYLIRRYFYPTEYFKDPSFFHFNKSKEQCVKNKIANLLYLNEKDEMKLNQLKSKEILKEINDNQIINNNVTEKQDFKEDDFIILRTIYSTTKTIYYLVLHRESFYVFLMKKITQKNEREIDFCKNYSHRCLVKFYGFLKKEDDITGFIYEYMCNNSLSYIINKKMKNDHFFSLTTINRIFQAIEYLHSNSLIHRDINATNILFDHDYVAYLSDFETIRPPIEDRSDSTQEMYTANIGSYVYASPEQIEGDFISYPTDIYSFGSIMHLILENKEIKFQKNGEIPLFKNASDNLQNLIKNCVKSEPKERLSTTEIKTFIINEINSFHHFEHYLINLTQFMKNSQIINFVFENILLQYNYNEQLNACFNNTFNFQFLFQKKFQENESSFLFELGNLYKFGIGVEKNYTKAIEFYEMSSKLQNSLAMFNLGNMYQCGYGVEVDYLKAKGYYELSGQLKNSKALLALGRLYFEGRGVDQDYPKARYYYELSSELNNSTALLNLGLLYYHGISVEQNYLKAIEYIEKSAQLNNSNALYHLGSMYENGEGVEQDYLKAKEYYELAGKQNNSEALFNLGLFYFNGSGVEQDFQKGIKYLELSSNLNNIDAIYNLGLIYYKGIGVDQDYLKAKKYFEIMAQQQNPLAYFILGNLYKDEKDYLKAKEYYELSAKQDNSDAFLNLASLYSDGLGVKRDYLKAKEYLEKAAKLDNSNALVNLGIFYKEGFGVQKDYSRARYYFDLASKQDNSYGFLNLGDLYFDGVGVEQNYFQAKHYYEIAAKKENSEALFNLGNIYEKGLGVKPDYLKAKDYYELAALNGNDSKSYFNLGIFYFNGLGVEQDYNKSINFIKQSAEQDNTKALFFLAELYSNGDIFEVNIQKAIEYFQRCIEICDENSKTCNKSENTISSTLNFNKYRYRSNSDLGLIYLIVLNDVEKSVEFIKEAGLNEYPFGQNNFGLLNLFYLNHLGNAEYMFQRAAKHKFSIAEFNLGRLKEKVGKIEESIQFFIDASDHEDEPLIFHNIQHYDKRLEISKTFIISFTNLKLVHYFLQKSDLTEAKKYFIRAFSKLIQNTEDLTYSFKYKFVNDGKNNHSSYLKFFFLNFPLFNLRKQPNINSILNQIEKELNQTFSNDEIIIESETPSKNFIEKIELLDFAIKENVNEKMKLNKRIVIQNETKSPQKELVFDNPNDFFEFRTQNKEFKNNFIKEINDLIQLIDSILYTPPYSILFGRILIEKEDAIKESNSSINNIDDSFYNGLQI
ncbi:hypothetical protein M9Y10_042566 [Tritrichomonas musculus]|uniref:Protein kinase domain-containing protein n=2 Tax=Tritrichomonas musculus TaxID=1915356 RepID=A0ABR2JX77_9EUKA